ncbi:Transposon tx1 uncharacterized protein [Thalictrum thalictroides]|uniref:Transposon tx1 uncharacterized protein n=1 Tax=Thalictrum thalictroides TaxID=46969 RepID=A0A7J6W1Y7_THATH|nr:Transposon tx1 uncharacterized protein [Thalictrum thalictroides]
MEAKVLSGGGLSNSFPISQGLQQGDPLSPLLFNFAINGFLVLLSWRLVGIETPGQLPTRCLAFADDCVVGLSCESDVDCFGEVLAAYELASNAKLNQSKTVAVTVGPRDFNLPFSHHPPGMPFRHLGVHFTASGIDLDYSEAALLQSIACRKACWGGRFPSLARRVILTNTFLLSKLWFLAHILPFSDLFYSRVEQLVQGWLWAPSRRHSWPISELFGPRSHGGMGLVNIREVARHIGAKWLGAVIVPAPLEELGWARAACIIVTHHIPSINQHSSFSLAQWLHVKPTRNGPHAMPKIYKEHLKAFKALKWQVVLPGLPSLAQGPPGPLLTLAGSDSKPCPPGRRPRRPKFVSQTPRLWKESSPLIVSRGIPGSGM